MADPLTEHDPMNGGADGAEGEGATQHGPAAGPTWTRRATLGGFAFVFSGLAGGAYHHFSTLGQGVSRAKTVPLQPMASSGSGPQVHVQVTDSGAIGEGVTTSPHADKTTSAGGPAKASATAESPQTLPPVQRPSGRPQVALVIDDLGLRQAETAAATRLPGPMTLAFLPYGQRLGEHTARAREKGHEVIVHMPMQAGERVNPGPNALLVGLAPDEILLRLKANLAQVPAHVGLNNHMGSVFTESAEGMELVLQTLHQNGHYFLDSRTTPRSAARSIAARLGVRYAERDVFLDNRVSSPYVTHQLAETENLARRYGTAIAIGHPHEATLSAIARWIDKLEDKGIDLVPVSAIIATRGSPYWRLARDRSA